MPTYESVGGFLRRLLTVPFAVGALSRRVRALGADVALCAMPAPLDLLMMRALRRAGVPAIVVVHDADMHPGDGLPFQMALQRKQTREADALVALTSHVAARLGEQGLAGRGDGGKRLFMASLPPLVFGPPAPPPGSHGGRPRLLSFGRLLPYKGLDLLTEALRLLGPAPGMDIRIVGSGPETADPGRAAGAAGGLRREPLGAGGGGRVAARLGGRGGAVSPGSEPERGRGGGGGGPALGDIDPRWRARRAAPGRALGATVRAGGREPGRRLARAGRLSPGRRRDARAIPVPRGARWPRPWCARSSRTCSGAPGVPRLSAPRRPEGCGPGSSARDLPDSRRRRSGSPRRPGSRPRRTSWRRACLGGWSRPRTGPRRYPPSRCRAGRPDLVIGCGGVAAAVGAALRRRGARVVQVQNPRMDPARFDLVVVNRHDEMTGPNVIVTRTALHRVTPERLAAAAASWAGHLAHLPRPLVAVLVGGTNGRFRLDGAVGADLATRLAGMMRADRVGVALTPSRRTDPAVTRALADTLGPLGGWVWDGAGDNPYFGLLGVGRRDRRHDGQRLDGVGGGGHAGAGHASRLPGGSRRIGLFTQGLIADGRVRDFAGRCEIWPVEPMNDTPAAAAEMRRRLGFLIGKSDAADPDLRPARGRQRLLQGAVPSAGRRGARARCTRGCDRRGRSRSTIPTASPTRCSRSIRTRPGRPRCSCMTCSPSGTTRAGLVAEPLTELPRAAARAPS